MAINLYWIFPCNLACFDWGVFMTQVENRYGARLRGLDYAQRVGNLEKMPKSHQYGEVELIKQIKLIACSHGCFLMLGSVERDIKDEMLGYLNIFDKHGMYIKSLSRMIFRQIFNRFKGMTRDKKNPGPIKLSIKQIAVIRKEAKRVVEIGLDRERAAKEKEAKIKRKPNTDSFNNKYKPLTDEEFFS